MRASVCTTPIIDNSPHCHVEVDLVIPDASAFTKPGQPPLVWAPVLGQRSVQWPDIFSRIQQPSELWRDWQPNHSLDKYKTVDDVWTCYNVGEPKTNSDGIQTGMKPPLRMVEQYFGTKWRLGATV